VTGSASPAGRSGGSPAADGRAAAVLFDMDGLLVDSEPVWTVAEMELARRLGSEWTPAIKEAVIGKSLPTAIPIILRLLGAEDADPDETSAWLLQRMVELFTAALPLRPGALRLLDALAETEIPLGLVSSSYRVLVDAALAELGGWRFAVTIAGDEVRRTKPHPEPYLVAAERLTAPPGACVVFEDSPSGVASAEAAGCCVVAVPDHVPIEPAPTREVIASLADVDVEWVLGLPGALRRAG
jgi:HAD superfamily hydrolase (TIGR01509 family)